MIFEDRILLLTWHLDVWIGRKLSSWRRVPQETVIKDLTVIFSLRIRGYYYQSSTAHKSVKSTEQWWKITKKIIMKKNSYREDFLRRGGEEKSGWSRDTRSGDTTLHIHFWYYKEYLNIYQTHQTKCRSNIKCTEEW